MRSRLFVDTVLTRHPNSCYTICIYGSVNICHSSVPISWASTGTKHVCFQDICCLPEFKGSCLPSVSTPVCPYTLLWNGLFGTLSNRSNLPGTALRVPMLLYCRGYLAASERVEVVIFGQQQTIMSGNDYWQVNYTPLQKLVLLCFQNETQLVIYRHWVIPFVRVPFKPSIPLHPENPCRYVLTIEGTVRSLEDLDIKSGRSLG